LSCQSKPIRIEIKRKPGCEDVPLPRYMSAGAAGMDVHAAVPGPVTLQPGEVKLIPTGFYMAVPRGYEAQVRPRSGLALKHGVTLMNTPGTIDSDYRNEVGIILANLGRAPFTVERGMRIAQIIIAPVVQAELAVVDELSETDRNMGGFGSTGI
jgi:dUTP pyrophosphatase